MTPVLYKDLPAGGIFKFFEHGVRYAKVNEEVFENDWSRYSYTMHGLTWIQVFVDVNEEDICP